MRPFTYARAHDEAEAIGALRQNPRARLVAGGTNLLDLMKLDVEQPETLVDINPLSFSRIHETPRGLQIGALARMADVAASPRIRQRAPVIAEALLASAAPQLRNMASIRSRARALMSMRWSGVSICSFMRSSRLVPPAMNRAPGWRAALAAASAGERARSKVKGLIPGSPRSR